MIARHVKRCDGTLLVGIPKACDSLVLYAMISIRQRYAAPKKANSQGRSYPYCAGLDYLSQPPPLLPRSLSPSSRPCPSPPYLNRSAVEPPPSHPSFSPFASHFPRRRRSGKVEWVCNDKCEKVIHATNGQYTFSVAFRDA